jgi:hypothetical protein
MCDFSIFIARPLYLISSTLSWCYGLNEVNNHGNTTGNFTIRLSVFLQWKQTKLLRMDVTLNKYSSETKSTSNTNAPSYTRLQTERRAAPHDILTINPKYFVCNKDSAWFLGISVGNHCCKSLQNYLLRSLNPYG